MVPVLYHNQGDGTYLDVGAQAIASEAQGAFSDATTHDVGEADFDHDGDMDLLFATNLGMVLLEQSDISGASPRFTLPLDAARFGPTVSSIVARSLALYAHRSGQVDVIAASDSEGLLYLLGVDP